MSVRDSDKIIANEDQTRKIIELIESCKNSNNVVFGANEVTKSITKGISLFVILANDAEPIEIIAHLPEICVDKNVPFVYVSSKENLGRACGITRNAIAVSLVSDTERSADVIDKSVQKIIRTFLTQACK